MNIEKLLNETLIFDNKELFIKHFSPYLESDEEKDFIINLDDIWQWMGYSTKATAKRKFNSLNLLENIEYIYEEEKILMTICTFKKFCLKSDLKQADQIHDYFLKMEKIVNKQVKKQLEEANMQLHSLKNKRYEECDVNGNIYVIETDGGIKIGYTKYNSHKRIKSLQTGNVNDIKIIYEQDCHDPSLSEGIIHKILNRYRCKDNREFFDVNIDYIVLVVKYVINTMDTIFSTYDKITQDEVFERLAEKYSGMSPIKIDTIETVTKTITTISRYDKENNVNVFEAWCKEHIVQEENYILQLKEVASLYTGIDRVHSKMSSQIKKQIEEFLKTNFGIDNFQYRDSTFQSIKYKGWLHFKLV
jgi:hypothetical protein